MSRKGSRLAGVLAAAGGVATVLFCGSRLDRASRAGPEADLLYLPSGQYLTVASLGQRPVLADSIYLWAIQYYGHYEIKNRYQYVDKIFREVITELDPKYTDPYWIGALIMTIEAKDLDMGLRLLDKGIAANPEQWILPYLAGWECYHAHRYDLAVSYFEKAIAVPGAPSVIRRAYAGMFQKLGDREASLAAWRSIAQDPGIDERAREIAVRRASELQVELDVEALRQAVERYRVLRGAPPPTLAALATEHLLPVVPEGPNGRSYPYDPRTGQVGSPEALVLQAQ